MNINKVKLLFLAIAFKSAIAHELLQTVEVEVKKKENNTNELSKKVKNQTLAAYLEGKAFVDSSSFGPSVGRPVVKGMDSYRIGILNGITSLNDLSAMSHDHSVSTMPKTSQKIKYIKGSSSLLYGNYSGGLVQILSQENNPKFKENEKKVIIDSVFGTNGVGNLYSLKTGISDKNKAIHFNTTHHSAKDYNAGNNKLIKDSKTTSSQSHLVLSYKLNDSFLIKPYWDTLNKEYSIPNNTSEETSISMEQKKYGFVLHSHKVLFSDYIQTQVQRSDYLHTEYEASRADGLFGQEQISINNIAHFNFENALLKTSLEYQNSSLKVCHEHNKCTNFKVADRTSIVDGVELQKNIDRFSLPFSHGHPMPNIDENILKIGLSSKYFLNDLYEINFAFRKEFRKLKSDSSNIQEQWLVNDDIDKNFYKDINDSAFSSSLGLAYLGDNFTFEGNFAYIQRLAAPSELFWNGFHHATDSYIFGNRYLKNEESKNIDLEFKYDYKNSSSKIAVFYYDFDNYIFQKPNENLKDPFHNSEVWQMQGKKASLKGLALKQSIKSNISNHSFINSLSYEFIKAKLDDGENIPRISPAKIILESDYKYKKYKTNLKYKYVFKSKDKAKNETSTPSYSWLSFLVSYENKNNLGKYEIYLKGENITNELAYNHISFLKQNAPLNGRQISLGIKYEF